MFAFSFFFVFCARVATDEVEQDIAAFEGEMGEVREKMDKLKSVLYTKFGSAINLEEE